MNNLVEVLNLVEAALAGDRKKGLAYAKLLAEKLDAQNEQKAALRVRRAIESNPMANVMAAYAVIQERLPVDTESRLSLADEVMLSRQDVHVSLNSEVNRVVNEFISYVEAADELTKEGVGIAPSLLLYGPPGCGKTELARYIAAHLGLPLITARVDTLISSFLGSTSKNIRLLFDHVADRRCVLFLDEFDALAKLRDDRQELGELKRVVVSLLQNIDSIEGQTVLLAATNHEHLLDPAIWRRFSYHVNVGLPTLESRSEIFKKYLGSDLSKRALDKFALASEGLSGSDIRQIAEASRRASIVAKNDAVTESDILRRILMRIVNDQALSVPELFAQAKARQPRVYTHRVLAEAFDMTPGNVTHILNRIKRPGKKP